MTSNNVTFRAVSTSQYARQHHLPGNSATPTIAFHDVQNSGFFLDDIDTGEIGITVKGVRRGVFGNALRLDGDLIVDGIVKGGDGNSIAPVTDFGNIQDHVRPDTTETYDLGSSSKVWKNAYLGNVFAGDTVVQGNISVAGNAQFNIDWSTVPSSIVPGQNNAYDIGSDPFRWGSVYAVNANATSVSAETIVSTAVASETATISSLAVSNTVDSHAIVSGTIHGNSIVADSVTVMTELLDSNGDPFVKMDFAAVDQDIIPDASNAYSIGNETTRFSNTYTKNLFVENYFDETGQPLSFYVDYGNLTQTVAPEGTYDLGRQSQTWDNVYANTILVSSLLEQDGTSFIKYTNLDSSLIGGAASAYDIGSTDRPWGNLYSDRLHGYLDGSYIDGNLSGNIGITGNINVPDGSATEPSIAFINDEHTGIFRPGPVSMGFAVGGSSKLVITDTSVVASVFGDANTVYYGDGTNMTFNVDRLQITSVSVTDASFTSIDDTAIPANQDSYIKVYGASFEPSVMNCRVGDTWATQVSVVDFSEMNVTLPNTIDPGTYDVTVTKNDTESSTLVNGIVVSNIPAWTTNTDLGYVYANIAYNIQISASDGSSLITYRDVQDGPYHLPPTTTIDANGFVQGNITQETEANNVTYNFDVEAEDEEYQSSIKLFTLHYVPQWSGGDKSASSILSLSRTLFGPDPNGNMNPQSGGTMTIGGEAVCAYDVTLKEGDYTITSSWTESDWFTSVQDSRAAFIHVFGDLTIENDAVFKPATRKPITVVHVSGDLILHGEISMSGRGADNSSNVLVTASSVTLVKGTFGSVVDPKIAASGSSGAAAAVTTAESAQTGDNGGSGTSSSTGLKTGGGGAGGAYSSSTQNVTSGAGSSGTWFCGGIGGGGIYTEGTYTGGPAGSGSDAGGAGGSAIRTGTTGSAGGGAGNPGGSGTSPHVASENFNGKDGAGGILVVVVDGTVSGNGSITANGQAGGSYAYIPAGGSDVYPASGGGGSGGGIAVLFYKHDVSGVTLHADGGSGGLAQGSGNAFDSKKGGGGGSGGDGTTYPLKIV